jgi:hypothetical protein
LDIIFHFGMLFFFFFFFLIGWGEFNLKKKFLLILLEHYSFIVILFILSDMVCLDFQLDCDYFIIEAYVSFTPNES